MHSDRPPRRQSAQTLAVPGAQGGVRSGETTTQRSCDSTATSGAPQVSQSTAGPVATTWRPSTENVAVGCPRQGDHRFGARAHAGTASGAAAGVETEATTRRCSARLAGHLSGRRRRRPRRASSQPGRCARLRAGSRGLLLATGPDPVRELRRPPATASSPPVPAARSGRLRSGEAATAGSAIGYTPSRSVASSSCAPRTRAPRRGRARSARDRRHALRSARPHSRRP